MVQHTPFQGQRTEIRSAPRTADSRCLPDLRMHLRYCCEPISRSLFKFIFFSCFNIRGLDECVRWLARISLNNSAFNGEDWLVRLVRNHIIINIQHSHVLVRGQLFKLFVYWMIIAPMTTMMRKNMAMTIMLDDHNEVNERDDGDNDSYMKLASAETS